VRGCHSVRERRALEAPESLSPKKADLQSDREIYLTCVVITAADIAEREGEKSLSSKLVIEPFTAFRSMLPS